MDEWTFDGIARTVASAGPTRRGLLAGLGGSALAALLTRLGWEDAEAKTKRKKRRKCKGNKKRCGKRCIPKTACCTNAQCPGGKRCQGRACVCPDGSKECAGRCLPDGSCCTNADCKSGELCLANGDCTCGGNPSCPNGKVCLSSGSCATPCTEGSLTCPGDCFCSFATTEGPSHCVAPVSSCGDIPQACTSTAQCPQGQQCQQTLCGPGTTQELRCYPLCG